MLRWGEHLQCNALALPRGIPLPPHFVYFLFITEKATAAPTTTASPTIATNLPPTDASPFPVPVEGLGTAPKDISLEISSLEGAFAGDGLAEG